MIGGRIDKTFESLSKDCDATAYISLSVSASSFWVKLFPLVPTYMGENEVFDSNSCINNPIFNS